MDQGDGTFKRFEGLEALRASEAEMKAKLGARYTPKSVFEVGEEVKIKDSRFKVVAIGTKFMKLQLLPHA